MDYVRHLVQRYKLESQVQYRSFVPGATWDEGSSRWTVEVKHRPADGEEEVQHWTAQHLVLATGCLSAPNLPKFPGMEDYKGELYHTARWPKDGVDFAGKTVAVIGTGSSAVQSIPVIAEKAKDLTVFQRTATYTIPAWNRTLTQEELEAAKLDSQELRKIGLTHPLGNATFAFTEKSWGEYTPEEREARLEHIWNLGGLNFYGSFADLLLNKESSDGARDFLHRKIKSIVKDQKTAELLCPVHPPGCKRICADTDYYKTYNKPNVHLVSVKDNAIKVVGGKDGKIVLEDGTAYGPFDVIVSATGFDAMTGTLMKLNIVGKDGLTLQKAWEAGPVNYLGLFIAGFPNMYHIAGPGSPSVLTNMIVSIEQHVEWIADCIKKMREQGYKTVEATEKAQADWVGHVNAVADATLLKNCTSWYLGANIPGKPQVFMPLLGLPDYVVKCNEVLATFDGLKLTK
ncbi:cyclohexanone monooxygenase [Hyaloraphidium curvatum]|nr:cyclohexanone monooxygenase [Hyaloraphidium curvatum]